MSAARGVDMSSGRLHLSFEADARGTSLVRQEMRAPLRCIRPFALGPREVVLQLLHVGPGLMAGDRFDLDVRVGAGAAVVLIAQSATKLHAMDDGASAEQHVRLQVAAGGSLEYHPGLTIPFARSAFRQQIDVRLAEGARFALVERWSIGRVARGERHAYRSVSSRIDVAIEGRRHYADALELDPSRADLPGLLEGHDYLATGVLVGGTGGFDAANEAKRVSTFHLPPTSWALRQLSHDGVALGQDLSATVNAWRRLDGRAPVAFERYGS